MVPVLRFHEPVNGDLELRSRLSKILYDTRSEFQHVQVMLTIIQFTSSPSLDLPSPNILVNRYPVEEHPGLHRSRCSERDLAGWLSFTDPPSSGILRLCRVTPSSCTRVSPSEALCIASVIGWLHRSAAHSSSLGEFRDYVPRCGELPDVAVHVNLLTGLRGPRPN